MVFYHQPYRISPPDVKHSNLFIRHAANIRHGWQTFGANRLIKICQKRAERLARFNRKQVLESDNWMDEQMPF